MEPDSNSPEETVFAKIIRREIPADIVYEDEHTLAFLSIEPTNHGHTLVIPKKYFKNIFDIDDETLDHLMHTVRKIAPGVRDGVGAAGINMNSNNEAAAGQAVFHFHIHLIPRFADDGLVFWDHKSYAPGESATVAEKIRTAIN